MHLLIFHTMFGEITTKKTKKNKKTENIFFKKIALTFFSNNKKNKDTKKYIAAYLDKKAKPKNKPNNTKLIIFGFSNVFKSWNRERLQKKTSNTSVDKTKDEKETAGIKKNAIDAKTAKFLSFHNFSAIKKIT